MTILTSVTKLEDRFVDTVKNLQDPVVEYVRKGVERVEGRFPKLRVPSNLPKPHEVVDSQFEFAKDLLEVQRSFVNELVEAVSPLVTRTEQTEVGAADAAKESAPAKATTAAPARPAAKTTKSTAKKGSSTKS